MFPQVKVLGKNLKQPHDPHTTGITHPPKRKPTCFLSFADLLATKKNPVKTNILGHLQIRKKMRPTLLKQTEDILNSTKIRKELQTALHFSRNHLMQEDVIFFCSLTRCLFLGLFSSNVSSREYSRRRCKKG